MSGSFETVRYTENALKVVDQLLLDAFQVKTGAQPLIPRSPYWFHRKVTWQELSGNKDLSRRDYLIEIVGSVVISTDEQTMPYPWPYWERNVRIRLVMVPAHGSRSWLCKKAVGMIEGGTMIRYSRKKENMAARKAMGLLT